MRRIVGTLVSAAAMIGVAVPAAIGPASPAQAAVANVTCDPQPLGGAATTPPLLSYTPINPLRLVDTRNSIGGVGVPLDRGCTMIVDIGTDIPSNAQAVALSMTAVNSEADYFTVYPCNAGRPETSNLNARAGFATPNLVVAIPDANRRVCIYSHGRSDLIIDLSGWWSDGTNRFGSIAPQRVYDSRQPGFTALTRFSVREVRIPTSVIPANSTAAVVNLTAANAVQPGYMTAFPCGQPVPNASNVNFKQSEARAVGAIVGLGLGNTLCVVADTTVHVIVDVTGFYAAAPGFGPTAVVEPTAGRRVVDSRNGIGGPLQPLEAGEVRSFDPVEGTADAADAAAVMLNFVSTDAAGAGFLTAYPCGGAVPNVSALNYVAGEAATNLATIELGVDRRVCIVSSVRTNVIVDVFAVMTAPPGSPVERLTFDKPTWPPFNAAATDYAIECGAGTTAGGGTSSVSMSVDLLPFTTATLSVAGGPPAAVGTGTSTFVLATDQPVVLATTREGVARNYHFRCVPTDFPRLEVQRPGNPSAGWYLTTSGFASTNPTRNGPFVMILDHYGAPVWYKRTPGSDDGREAAVRRSPGLHAVVRAVRHRSESGLLAHQPAGHRDDQAPDRRLPPARSSTDHHDYIELPPTSFGPNARAQVSYPIRTDGTLPFGAPSDTYSDGVIQEIDGAGTLLWEWEMHQHFEPESSTFPQNFESTPGFAGTGWDVFHINAIDRITSAIPADDGDYVVTARHMDGVFRVDRPSGNVRWTLGTPSQDRPTVAVGSSRSSVIRTTARSDRTMPG